MTENSPDQKKVESPADIDGKTGQPIEEAEDNLSRHSTKDSSAGLSKQGGAAETQDKS